MPAGVHDGTEAFAFTTTKRPTLRLTQHLLASAATGKSQRFGFAKKHFGTG